MSEAHPWMGLESRSTGVRKRPKRGGARGKRRRAVPQPLAGRPESTQPGGTAIDAGSHPTAGRRQQVVRGAAPPESGSQKRAGPPTHYDLTELLTIFSSKGCQLTSRTQALWLVSFFTMWPLRRSYTAQGKPEWRRDSQRTFQAPLAVPEPHCLPASQATSPLLQGSKAPTRRCSNSSVSVPFLPTSH